MFFSDLFTLLIYQPLYNALVFLAGTVTFGDVGLAIILLTIIVKAILIPLSHRGIKTQRAVRTLEPKIKEIRDKHKDQQEQARKIMNLYKEHGVNPFSGCLLTLIQLPIIFGLYWVFWRGLQDGSIDASLLYSFVDNADAIRFTLLDWMDLSERSILFAILAGVSQFIQMHFALPPQPKEKPKSGKEVSFSEELRRGMSTQMRYVLPVVITVISFGFPSAVPLYWTTSNIFSIAHELLVRREANKILSEGEDNLK